MSDQWWRVERPTEHMPGFVKVAIALVIVLGVGNLWVSLRAVAFRWTPEAVAGVPSTTVFILLLLPALLAAGGVLFGGTMALIARRSGRGAAAVACVLAALANAAAVVMYFVTAGHALDALG